MRMMYYSRKAWVVLGKVWCEFGHFGVKICDRGTFPNATLTFSVCENFENRPKPQRRRSAWVGQADFGKLGLNNSHHSGNCHRLSVNTVNNYYNPSQFFFFSVAAWNIHNI